ncbi:Holliday junction branch migration DNA helicase RuvB [Nonomuraea dietziae]
MSIERDLVSPDAEGDELQIEAALRPKRLADFIGQGRVARAALAGPGERAQAQQAARPRTDEPARRGLGKTTLAMIVAAELGAPLRITSGPALERAGDLAAILSTLTEGEVLFIDEIHRMARPAEEMLYLAMEDFRVDIIVGKGPGATAIPLEIAPFTLVGATTRAGLLPAPLRDRFGFTAHMDFYEVAELEQVLRRSSRLLGVSLPDEGAHEIARRSRGTPRIANRLLRRVRDFSDVRSDGVITRDIASAALNLYEVDAEGLDRLDRAVLGVLLLRKFGGGPVGLSTLAVAVGEEPETVEGGGRALPGAPGSARPHSARAGGDLGRLASPGADPAARRPVLIPDGKPAEPHPRHRRAPVQGDAHRDHR